MHLIYHCQPIDKPIKTIFSIYDPKRLKQGSREQKLWHQQSTNALTFKLSSASGFFCVSWFRGFKLGSPPNIDFIQFDSCFLGTEVKMSLLLFVFSSKSMGIFNFKSLLVYLKQVQLLSVLQP